MLVNDECSSWYNSVDDFLLLGLGGEEENFIWWWINKRDQLDQLHPLQSARPMAQSAMVVECE